MKPIPLQKKTAAYVRVSSRSQNVQSQKDAIERYISYKHLQNVEWYIDDGISGATLDRPEFLRLGGDISKGIVQTIVMYDLDRMARNAVEGLVVLHEWLKAGVRVCVITLDVDLEKVYGRMVASLLLHIAQMEREKIRERQRLGLQSARELHRRAIEMADQGHSPEYIGQAIGKPADTVRKMLAKRDRLWWGGTDGRPRKKLDYRRMYDLLVARKLSRPDASKLLGIGIATLNRHIGHYGGFDGWKRHVESDYPDVLGVTA